MILVHFFTETSACGGFPTSKIYINFQPSSPYNIINLILNFVHRKMHVQMDIIGWLFILKDNFFLISIVLVPILRWTRKDAPRCIWVLFMNRKTYDLRGLGFLHVDGSVRCCIPKHVEITHKQGKKSSSFVIHTKPPFFLMSKRSFTKIDPRLA